MYFSDEELDLSLEETVEVKLKTLETFAIEEISKLQEDTRVLQEAAEKAMEGDVAALKADLASLKTLVADQEQQLQELRERLERNIGPEVLDMPSTSGDDNSAQKRKREEEELDVHLTEFWPENPDPDDIMTPRQQAFFNFMMDHLTVVDPSNLDSHLEDLKADGVTRGVWTADFVPDSYLRKKMKTYIKERHTKIFEKRERMRLQKLVKKQV
ncbi:uncharacterized protein [Danio rerio]|uniref:Uncharacterized protein n=2 Tax=Danio rerio TaxID=7955 RepID=A0A8M9PZN7_DANRE|nr:uncharacterized protein LOC100535592 [Danio rerio]XP_021326575.1 uncharacterized protein LOC100535592 [Danio rerio]|eukprot:XP_017209970.1 uncharacterized protein LOC100535592 [Danio rerio]